MATLKLPRADAIAIELCALLGINGNEVENVQLPTYGRNRWELIAEAIRADRNAVLEAAAEESVKAVLDAMSDVPLDHLDDEGRPDGYSYVGIAQIANAVAAEIRKMKEDD